MKKEVRNLLLLVSLSVATCGLITATELLSPNSELNRLSAPPNQNLTEGRTTLSGTLSSEAPLCYVLHKLKKGKKATVQFGGMVAKDPRIKLPSGNEIAIDTNRARFEPFSSYESSKEESLLWRKELKLSSEGWIEQQCVSPGETFFLDGCIKNNVIGDCGKRQVLLITVGDGTAQYRLDESAASWLGLFAIVVLIAWFLLWAGRPRGGPLVLPLVAWRRASIGGKVWSVGRWVLTGFLVYVAARGTWHLLDLLGVFWVPEPAYLRVDRWGLAATTVSLFIALPLFISSRRSAKSLREATKTIEETPCVALSEVQGRAQHAELNVKTQDAATSPAPISQKESLWWVASMTHTWKEGKQRKSQTQTKAKGSLVPIQDSSGEGFLEMEKAAYELKSFSWSTPVERLTQADKQRLEEVYGPLPSTGSLSFEEKYITPGENLYLLGRVLRLAPSNTAQHYREASAAAVIGGDENPPKPVVYSGTERALLAQLYEASRYLKYFQGILLGLWALLLLFAVLFSLR